MIEQFLKAVAKGIEAWIEAGECLVEMLKTNPDAFADIIVRAPYITPSMLQAFLAIGQKRLYAPVLLLDRNIVSDRVMEMPYEAQVKACHEKIELLGPSGETEYKTLSEITGADSAMVFAATGLRSIDEQKVVSNQNQALHKPGKTIGGSRPVAVVRIERDEKGNFTIREMKGAEPGAHAKITLYIDRQNPSNQWTTAALYA